MTQFLNIPKKNNRLKDHILLNDIRNELTPSYRSGASLGPEAIREASHNLETYSPYQDLDLNDQKIADIGELSMGYPNLKQNNIKLLTLGGDHSTSLIPITKYLQEYDDLLILHLDAHADLRDEYEGDMYSHACIMARVLEEFGENHKLLQYGIRSGTEKEFDYVRLHQPQHNNLEHFIKAIRYKYIGMPIYITLDLDFFDPSELPGTGCPEAGGASFSDFIEIIQALRNKNVVGADVVELAPELDPTGRSSCMAAKVVRELMLVMGDKK